MPFHDVQVTLSSQPQVALENEIVLRSKQYSLAGSVLPLSAAKIYFEVRRTCFGGHLT